MFQAIIYERIKVIKGFVVGGFDVSHARDCNRQIKRAQDDAEFCKKVQKT